MVWGLGGAACGVQEGQENIDRARDAEKQLEERQRDLEDKLQEDVRKEEGEY